MINRGQVPSGGGFWRSCSFFRSRCWFALNHPGPGNRQQPYTVNGGAAARPASSRALFTHIECRASMDTGSVRTDHPDNWTYAICRFKTNSGYQHARRITTYVNAIMSNRWRNPRLQKSGDQFKSPLRARLAVVQHAGRDVLPGIVRGGSGRLLRD